MPAGIVPYELVKKCYNSFWTFTNSILLRLFSDTEKPASVSLVYIKYQTKNNEISNYGPLSVLNCFSKLYETVIKMQLVPFLERKFPPFLGDYRESYNTRQKLIRLLAERKKKTSTITFWYEVFYGSFKGIPLDPS